MKGGVRAAHDDLRDLARGIYPPVLADQGLGPALRAQARKAALPVEIEADGIGRYPQDTEAAVYFCTLEALQNITKYASARRPGGGRTARRRTKGASSPTGAGLAYCPGGLPCRHENRIPYRRERRSVREVQGSHLLYRHPVP